MSTERVARLAQQLQADGIDAYFAARPIPMGYLHGLFEEGHERFFTLAISSSGSVRLICPALAANQARRCWIEDIASWRDGEDPLALFRELAAEWGLKTGILAVDDDMPARMLLQMQEALPAALFKPGQSILSQLMRAKGPEELAAMRRAAKVADDAFVAIVPQIKAGMTERELEAKLTAEMTARGGVTQFCIIAAGPGGAEPHHLNDDTVLKEGDVVIMDFGCMVDHYVSDITRTVAIGHATDEAKQVYDVVYRAHMAARDAAVAGSIPEEVDGAARKVIEDAGYGEYFVHRTGHGIGMNTHEEPYIVAGNREPLAKGNCFSVEPGIYLAGRFGVRIENIVTIDDSGCVSLNAEPSPTLMIV